MLRATEVHSRTVSYRAIQESNTNSGFLDCLKIIIEKLFSFRKYNNIFRRHQKQSKRLRRYNRYICKKREGKFTNLQLFQKIQETELRVLHISRKFTISGI